MEAPAGGLLILFGWTALLLAAGLATFAFTASPFNSLLSQNDSLSLMTLSFLCLLAAGGFFFLGRKWMAAAAFPFAFFIYGPATRRHCEVVKLQTELEKSGGC